MPGAQEDLFDLTISHSVGLERYKAGVVRQVLELLQRSEANLRDTLAQRLMVIEEMGGYDAGPLVTARINELIEAIGTIRSAAFREVERFILAEMGRLATAEAAWAAASLLEVIPVELNIGPATAEVLNALVFERPFQGALLKDWAQGLARADLQRIDRALKIGIVEGQPVGDMVRSIMGTRAAKYQDGVLAVSRRGAEAVIRTATNHVVTAAREATYDANKDIVTGVRWNSTLDGRTTMVCMSRDGKVFPLREGPRPPAHWQCRSSTMPILDGVNMIGDRPTVVDTRDRRRREIDFRAMARDKAGGRWSRMTPAERNAAIKREREAWGRKAVGSVPKGTTYGDWLKKQPASFQDEVLGPRRAKLFREGGLSIDKFTDSSGKMYTLEELRRRESAAFRKAKL